MKRFGKLFLFIASCVSELLANLVNTFVKARRKRSNAHDRHHQGDNVEDRSKGGKNDENV